MPTYFSVADEGYMAFFNADMICMFRVHITDDGLVTDDFVEIDFVGGSKTKLHGPTAKAFLDTFAATVRNIR